MIEVNKFNAIRIRLASPDKMRNWSFGEVIKPETINYRTLKPERDGLFCERIFGPTRDWECSCGKYKKIRYRGIICDKCGVEVTRARVRRERMGHIELAAPVTHIWFLKGTPSRIGQVLDVTPRDLERIVYFASFIVTDLDIEARDAAIRRIDEDLSVRVAEIQASADQRSASVTTQAQDQIARLDQQLRDEQDRLETEAKEALSQLESEVRTLHGIVNANLGSAAPEALRASWREEPLLAKGSRYTDATQKAIDEALAAKVTSITSGLAAEQAGATQRFDAAKAAQRKEADQTLTKVNSDTDQAAKDAEAYFRKRATDLGELVRYQLLSEPRYQELRHTCGDVFQAGIGAEAILDLVQQVDLDALAGELRVDLDSPSIQRRKKAIKRLKVVEAFRRSGARPEWMIMTVLPVLPPDLRPMVQLDGGRFATSDLNDLYRRVINRNNRLKRLVELGAPEIIVRNEKRMLQEAVDALIDNGRRGRAVTGSSNHPYKSLSDMLRGKQGRFRQNLLGKRVDYSGRSVIVVGPHLKLNQCGLPTKMALELFKPFVMRKLVDYGYASNIKSAKRMVEHPEPVVWDALEEVTRNHPILLNRAPTLHRLGIQAFDIVLVKGSAIQIHPLVCTAFNADFDGDQMAVHVPLSKAAQDEARRLMQSTRNVLSPADGSPIISPTKDMVLGCYYLTDMAAGLPGEGKTFADFEDALQTFEYGAVALHAKVKLRVSSKDFPIGEGSIPDPAYLETTIGRILLNTALPRELRFVNERLDKGGLKRVIGAVFHISGVEGTVQVAERFKELGMRWATQSGVTMGIGDLSIPAVKQSVLKDTNSRVTSINDTFAQGLITDDERYRLTVKEWTDAMNRVSASVQEALDARGPVYMMGQSGAAKGNFDQIKQIAGMRGLMTDPSGKIIEMPVRSNFREGLSVLEYFISTHGARKGLADTALRTADSGYLTRRLVDVAQDVLVAEVDCGVARGTLIRVAAPGEVAESVGTRAFGRFTLEPVVHPETGEIIIEAGELVSRPTANLIDKVKVPSIHVRSVMTCRAKRGICQKCYGLDLGRNELVEMGAAVGIIAAQSIGEPATQLTMRTFHLGGVAGGTDIVAGLPRVEELFESRVPKGVAQVSDLDGTIDLVEDSDLVRIRVISAQIHEHEYDIGKRLVPVVEEGEAVTKDSVLALPKEHAEDLLQRKARSKSKSISKRSLAKVAGEGLTAIADGTIAFRDGKMVLRSEVEEAIEYRVPVGAEVRVHNGQFVHRGDQLTEGPLNPQDILRLRGREAVQRYIVDEIQRVYRIVGVAVNDKHIEVIIRQMLRRVSVDSSGDTDLLPGKLVDQFIFEATNRQAIAEGKAAATGHWVLLGVTKASLNNESFLAAASFQDTTRVLTEAVVEGKIDYLLGLKENVIIGKLIPAGTGWQRYHDRMMAASAAEALTNGDAGDAAVGLVEPPATPLGDVFDEDDDAEDLLPEDVLPIGEGDALDDVVADVKDDSSDEFAGFLQPRDDDVVVEESVETAREREDDDKDFDAEADR